MAGALAFFVIGALLGLAGEQGGNTLMDNPKLGFTMLAAGVCILGSGAAAAFAIFREGERSVLDLIGLLLGLYALFFLIGELLLTH